MFPLKKRILPFLLSLCLVLTLFCLPVQKAAAAEVCFSAVNDSLLELSADSMPVFIGGTLFVPYTMLNNSVLGVYFSHDRGEQKVSLLHGGKQIYFNMASGETFDAEGNRYDASAIYHNSKIYLPAGFICSFFGFSYAYINTSEELGPIVRIKDSNVIMNDTLFAQAARSLMRERLNRYLGRDPDGENSGGMEEEDQDHGDVSVHLGFTGTQGIETVLAELEKHDQRATFFLTEAQIREDPALVRRICCGGHNLGVHMDGETDFETASDLIFEAARRRVWLVSGGEAEVGVRCGYDLDAADGETDFYDLRDAAAKAEARLAVHFDCAAEEALLQNFLNYLDVGRFAVRPFNELAGGNADEEA